MTLEKRAFMVFYINGKFIVQLCIINALLRFISKFMTNIWVFKYELNFLFFFSFKLKVFLNYNKELILLI